MKKILNQLKKISAVALLTAIILSASSTTLSNTNHFIMPLGHGICLDYKNF